MMGFNACYTFGKPGHMMKDCSNKGSQEKRKDKVQPNSPSEEASRRNRFFALKYRGAGEGTSGDISSI